MPVKRLVVLAVLEVIGGYVGEVVAAGSRPLHAGAVERVEQVKPGEVLAHIALGQPWPVQFEHCAGHAVVGVQVQGRGLNGADTPQGIEQRGGKPRVPDALGHPGYLFEPLG